MSDLGNRIVFSKNLRYYMNKYGKSRVEICNALGIKYTTFTDWVNGNKYPRIDKIEMLASYFGIEKSDLIEDKDAAGNDSDDLTEELQMLRDTPETRTLLRSSRGLTADQLAAVTALMKQMRGSE